jgi:hypothetical protein
MRPPPTERHRAMAARRKEGATFSSIAREFGTTYELVRRVISQVERYDRGTQILQDNPTSLEGLELIRKLHAPAAKSLYARGYRTLHDLDGLTLVDFLVMPRVRRKDAETLVKLVAEARSAVARGDSGGEGKPRQLPGEAQRSLQKRHSTD